MTARAGTYIEELRIQDFALVSSQTVNFAPGLNAITGESGSGKSVLIEALAQLFGAAAPQECIRPPATAASIEGVVALSPAAARRVAEEGARLGLPARVLPKVGADGGSRTVWRLIIRREITAGPGADAQDAPPADALAPSARSLRSRCFVNGFSTSLRVLRGLGAALVDTNGQHAAVGLRDSDTQLQLLDRIAGTSALAASLSERQSRLAAVLESLRGLDAMDDEAERARVEKLVALVDKARIEPGEELRLRAQIRSMEARRASLEQAALLRAAIRGESGGGGLLDGMRTLAGQLGGLVAAEEAISMEEEAARKLEGQGYDEEEEEEDGDAGDTPSPSPAAASNRHSNGHRRSGGGGAARAGGAYGDEDEDDEEEGEEAGDPSGLDHLEICLEALEVARARLQAAADGLSKYSQAHDFSAADYSEATSRLDLVERLMRSQRAQTSEAMLEAVEAAAERLERYYDAEGCRDGWEEEAESLRQQLLDDCLQLSAARQAAAGRLRAAVEDCLGQLAMGGCRFDVRISWEPAPQGTNPAKCLQVGEAESYKLRPQGLDQVEFLLAPGPSEPLRPLAAIASGGESARVMMALKAAPAAAAAAADAAAAAAAAEGAPAVAAAAGASAGGDREEAPAPVLVLDELDSGVGSRLGLEVGRLLRRMCRGGSGGSDGGGGGASGAAAGAGAGQAASQILCVTHLPQVAAFADHHIVVAKSASSRTETIFEALRSEADRAREVAAMMGTAGGGEEAARQLLAEAAADAGGR